MGETQKTIWIVSFDGVAISGIITEAMKMASLLNERDFRILLDVGYDIKPGKSDTAKPPDYEKSLLPDWVTLASMADIAAIEGYNAALLEEVFQAVCSDDCLAEAHPDLYQKITIISAQLAENICQRWRAENVAYVIVENGTLPENIIYTKALYQAIEDYGRTKNLSKYVLWRDHDLMWSSETTSTKYGNPPYCNSVKPVASPHILYLALHQVAADKMQQWAGAAIDLKVLPNTYNFELYIDGSFVRNRLNLKQSDIVISRLTRLIFPKRVDRDIYLISRLKPLFKQRGIDIYLLITGGVDECPECYQALQASVKSHGLGENILFLGAIPNTLGGAYGDGLSVETVIAASDLISFLTAYDYDSYGNPIGEAISQATCYISTQYEYYDTVYGAQGYLAPIMPISKDHDGIPDDQFVDQVYQLLSDPVKMSTYANFNYQRGKAHFSSFILKEFCKFFT